MGNEPQGGAPINPTDPGAVLPAGHVAVPQAELDDLRRRADSSSQNFERLKKTETLLKEKEAELEALQTGTPPGEGISDEGRALMKEIDSLKSKISSIESDGAIKELKNSNPIFKDKWTEFEEFRAKEENKGMNLKTAAKAFLVENGLLDPVRKGLEQPTGGPRQSQPSGKMTAEDVKKLRETNYKEYEKLLMEGKLNDIVG